MHLTIVLGEVTYEGLPSYKDNGVAMHNPTATLLRQEHA